MAVFAGVPRRAQVFHWRRNGPGIGTKGDRKNLAQAGDFGAYEPARSWPYVAFDAFDPRVRGVLVSRKFRRHHCVARLTTERRGIHVGHAFVGSERKNQDVQQCRGADEQKTVLHHRNLQIDFRIYLRKFSGNAQLPPAQQNSRGNQ
jgi:hypothetical protein